MCDGLTSVSAKRLHLLQFPHALSTQNNIKKSPQETVCISD